MSKRKRYSPEYKLERVQSDGEPPELAVLWLSGSAFGLMLRSRCRRPRASFLLSDRCRTEPCSARGSDPLSPAPVRDRLLHPVRPAAAQGVLPTKLGAAREGTSR